MSKDIVIQIGGVSQDLDSVEEIRTSTGSGNTVWVPEDEKTLGVKTITANGSYEASDDGMYGYSKAVVNVPKKYVTGRGADGNDYTYSVDDEGNLSSEKEISAIVVTTPPSVLTYDPGAALNFDGIVVTGYDGNGQSMGTIPFSELIFPVTHAPQEASTIDYTATLEDVGSLTYVESSLFAQGDSGYNCSKSCRCIRYGEVFLNLYNTEGFTCTREPSTYTVSSRLLGQTSNSGTLVYSATMPLLSSPPISPNVPSYSDLPDQYIIDILFDGDATVSGGSEIPVQWARPSDRKVLGSSFRIQVLSNGTNS